MNIGEANCWTRVQKLKGGKTGRGRGFSQFEAATIKDLLDRVISRNEAYRNLLADIMQQKWPAIAAKSGRDMGSDMINAVYRDLLNTAMTAIKIKTVPGTVPDMGDLRAVYEYYIKPVS